MSECSSPAGMRDCLSERRNMKHQLPEHQQYIQLSNKQKMPENAQNCLICGNI